MQAEPSADVVEDHHRARLVAQGANGLGESFVRKLLFAPNVMPESRDEDPGEVPLRRLGGLLETCDVVAFVEDDVGPILLCSSFIESCSGSGRCTAAHANDTGLYLWLLTEHNTSYTMPGQSFARRPAPSQASDR
jgi:hypothetical protein